MDGKTLLRNFSWYSSSFEELVFKSYELESLCLSHVSLQEALDLEFRCLSIEFEASVDAVLVLYLSLLAGDAEGCRAMAGDKVTSS